MITTDDFTKISHDTNGNPRYVCSFLSIPLSDLDKVRIENKVTIDKALKIPYSEWDHHYAIALSRAKQLGGRKFHNKQYGGGIVFQSYNLQDTCNRINELMNQY